MEVIHYIHSGYVHHRRVRVLSEHFAALLPDGASVLDVGCGDGLLARALVHKRPDIDVQGVDVLRREQTHIPVQLFDGRSIPYGDKSFDAVLFADVLHHTEEPMRLLREAVRVAKRALLIKDHTLTGFLAGPTLRVMDAIGNARYGVALPYHYWPLQRWQEACDRLGLQIREWRTELGLYPRLVNWLCGRSLHFVALLELPS